jgi:hypothetical protein
LPQKKTDSLTARCKKQTVLLQKTDSLGAKKTDSLGAKKQTVLLQGVKNRQSWRKAQKTDDGKNPDRFNAKN